MSTDHLDFRSMVHQVTAFLAIRTRMSMTMATLKALRPSELTQQKTRWLSAPPSSICNARKELFMRRLNSWKIGSEVKELDNL